MKNRIVEDEGSWMWHVECGSWLPRLGRQLRRAETTGYSDHIASETSLLFLFCSVLFYVVCIRREEGLMLWRKGGEGRLVQRGGKGGTLMAVEESMREETDDQAG
jgi:hypothetical protein